MAGGLGALPSRPLRPCLLWTQMSRPTQDSATPAASRASLFWVEALTWVSLLVLQRPGGDYFVFNSPGPTKAWLYPSVPASPPSFT